MKFPSSFQHLKLIMLMFHSEKPVKNLLCIYIHCWNSEGGEKICDLNEYSFFFLYCTSSPNYPTKSTIDENYLHLNFFKDPDWLLRHLLFSFLFANCYKYEHFTWTFQFFLRIWFKLWTQKCIKTYLSFASTGHTTGKNSVIRLIVCNYGFKSKNKIKLDFIWNGWFPLMTGHKRISIDWFFRLDE